VLLKRNASLAGPFLDDRIFSVFLPQKYSLRFSLYFLTDVSGGQEAHSSAKIRERSPKAFEKLVCRKLDNYFRHNDATGIENEKFSQITTNFAISQREELILGG
jgi:hypothetical protein